MMERKTMQSFPFENTMIISGASGDIVPTDALFAERGKTVAFASMPWNLESWTGPFGKDSKNLLLRASFSVPDDGWYVLGAGADWFFRIWIDGILRMDKCGNTVPDPENHLHVLYLKAGKHTADIWFSRGKISARFSIGLFPSREFPQFGEIPCSVDFSRKTGHLKKELHGSNTTVIFSGRINLKNEEALKKLNFTYSRTHDWALWNPGQRIIDTHFIFPLMHLDPKNPANYYFEATDEIIRLTQEVAGLKVFYRLGTSIEYTGKHFNIRPPEDPEKYAEVLAGIVRHYTKGWANGFYYDIKYWEIWNEPNGSELMWAAPLPTFTPFFITVLKRLKKEFPDLCFGGPAFSRCMPEWFLPVLEECRKAGVAPDFISWHCYLADPDFLIAQPKMMRRFLDNMGFTKTKLCIDEWHYLESWKGIISSGITSDQYRNAVMDGPSSIHGINSGVYNLAVLIGWQNTPLDLGMWYGSNWDGNWGFRNMFKEYTKNYWSLYMFGQFLKEYPVKCYSTSGNQIYLLAACSEDGTKAGILVADYKGRGTQIRIPLKGAEQYGKITALILDDIRNNEPVPVIRKDDSLILNKAHEGSAAFFVRLEK